MGGRLEFALFALLLWVCTAVGAGALVAFWLGVPAGALALVLSTIAIAVLLTAFYREFSGGARRR